MRPPVLKLHLGLWLLLLFAATPARAQTDATERARALVRETQTASYPELNGVKIDIKPFRSDSDFFQSRFAFGRFFTGRRMRYIIYVNPLVYEKNCPQTALRAIIAHELAHVLYYRRRNRLELLGLARLAGKGFTARFERGADLEALARGYGAGLKEYRLWLYQNIPPRRLAEKRRNYFSPDEIDALTAALQKRPALLAYWRKRVPRSLVEVEQVRD